MSSFKKRSTAVPIPGTRPSSSSSLPLLSTGLATVDDLLGGGLPLSASLLVTQDYPTSYSELLLRYFVAQGLDASQDVLLIAPDPRAITRVLMGHDKGTAATATATTAARQQEDREDDEERKRDDDMKDKMKIAFRYEGMKQHQTTLATQDDSAYCSTFDLTTTRTLSPVDLDRLHLVDVDELHDTATSPAAFYDDLYQRLETFVSENGYLSSNSPVTARKALRIVISSLGSPSWGPSPPSSLYTFAHRLRSLLRRSTAAAFTTFPSHLFPSTSSSSDMSSSSSSSSPSPILSRLSHASDAVLSLVSTSQSPTLAALYPSHQGLLTLPKLPSVSALVPPSTKLSLLRNLGGGGHGRENLVGFRVKRRRFVVEVVSEEPALGDDDAERERERKQRERRRRVDEANRKDREESGTATDVLLKEQDKHKERRGRIAFEPENPAVPPGAVELEPAMRNVRIGDVEASSPRTGDAGPPASAFKKKKKGVRMGGVSFDTDGRGALDDDGGGSSPREKKKVSISAMLHQQPELLDF
ncbi:hypothetical protein JCM11491_002252 [Sporobolomyces phaffii]